MYESELFHAAKHALEDNTGVQQLLNLVPKGTEFSVILDNRIPCTLRNSEGKTALAPEPCSTSDFEVILFSESIRRLSADSQMNLATLLKTLITLRLDGSLKISRYPSLYKIYQLGYLKKLKKIISR